MKGRQKNTRGIYTYAFISNESRDASIHSTHIAKSLYQASGCPHDIEITRAPGNKP